MRRLACVAVLGLLAVCAPAARADWNGDGHADVLAENASIGNLFLYRANGAGGWITGHGEQVGGSGWTFPTLVYPGDFSGDGAPDLLAVASDARLILYRGNGTGAFAPGVGLPIGSGWSFPYVFSPGDFDGDGHPDVMAVGSDGHLYLYRGNGDGGWITGSGEPIGCCGWAAFTAVFAGGDFNGDGHPDVMARTSDGRLLLYRGNGSGGWLSGDGQVIGGGGWQSFTALMGGGDYDGDGLPDVLARTADGHLLLYRGNGAGGWITGTGEVIGSGWEGFQSLLLVPGVKTPPPPPPPAPPVAPLPGAQAQVKAGKHCTVPGRRMKVTLKVRRVRGRPAPHVRRIVFFVPHGSRLVDHHRPYLVHLRMNQPAGTHGRVYARIFFRRSGERKVRHKTVSRPFKMCGKKA